MITKVTAYKSSDDKTFGTLEEVQKHELALLFDAAPLGPLNPEQQVKAVTNAVACIINNRDKVMDILATTGKSKPKAGGTKRRGSRAVTPPSTPAGTQA